MRQRLQAVQAWAKERWLGTIPTAGFLLVAAEFGARLILSRPVDPEVVPFAIVLILWKPQRRKQDRRNREREDR